VSIQAVAWVLDLDVRDPHEKLILISLANHADASGFCWPTMRTIGKEASCDRRTVLRRLPRLVAAGFVRILEAREGKQKLAHTYQLLMPGCDPQSQPPSRLRRKKGSKPRRPPVTRGCDSAVTTDNHQIPITSSKPPSKATAPSEIAAAREEETKSPAHAKQSDARNGPRTRDQVQQLKLEHALRDRASFQKIQSDVVTRLGQGDVGKGWLLFGELSESQQEALTAQQRRGALDEQTLARVRFEIKHSHPP
jgi:hypothetical protein